MNLSILSESQLDLCQRAYDENMKTKDPMVNAEMVIDAGELPGQTL